MMKKTAQNRLILTLLWAVLLILSVHFVMADDLDGYEPANTLPWPLLNQVTNQPRQAVWSSFCEYQNYIGYTPWFHSGFDIRGLSLDKVIVVDSGNVWMVANLAHCSNVEEGSGCRLYIKSMDQRYIYYYSHLYLGSEIDITSTAWDKIMNASPQRTECGCDEDGDGDPPFTCDCHYPVKTGTDVARGDTLAFITDFGDDGAAWDHLHFGIIDAHGNYDMLNPLTAFASVPIDDEPPTIASLEFYQAGTPETVNPLSVTPQGACHVVSGNLDIVAKMKDTFYTTNPAPGDITGGAVSTGIYEARYIVRPVNSATPVVDKIWYRFDRAPLSCAGELRGNDCSSTVDIEKFYKKSINHSTGSGAAHWGESYASILYSNARSNSDYDGTEKYAHILTNSWGVDGSWNTASMADGLYQVSVEASDLAGNKAAMSRFVYVHNDSGSFNPDLVTPDAYIRDNVHDIGDIPSTLGGRPFWTSPDIVVVPQGAATPPVNSDYAGNAQVFAGWTYDVYIRIHNDRCVDVEMVKAKVYSTNPAMIIDDQTEWNPITGGNFVGDSANPNGVTVPAGGAALLGPLPWTPTAAEAASNNGHRCMLAYITSADDPYTTLPDVVKDNDNFAQRNMQVEGLTAFSIYNPEPDFAAVELVFNCGSMPMHNPDTVVRLSVEYHPALASAWFNVPGTTLTHDTPNNKLHLDIRLCNITLPAATLPAYTRLPASVTLELPLNVGGTFQVHFSERVNGLLRGGMSFEVTKHIVE